MERMSGEITPDTETAPKPLIPLLGAPVDLDDDASAASRCCGGSCSLG